MDFLCTCGHYFGEHRYVGFHGMVPDCSCGSFVKAKENYLLPNHNTVDIYTSNPVDVHATQWDGTQADAGRVIEWIESNGGEASFVETNETGHRQYPEIHIQTLEGRMATKPTDYVIQGTINEFYPCKEEVFDRKYHLKSEQS